MSDKEKGRTMKQCNGQGIREQRGIVLIVSLLVLTVLSVLGLAFLGREGITLGRVAQMSDAPAPQEVRT